MWVPLQNSRPVAPTSSAKAHSPTMRDKFKIYTSSPSKTKVPSSEETRHRPIKAYTLRASGRVRTTFNYSMSPTKIGHQAHKDSSPLSVVIAKGLEKDMILPTTREVDSENDTQRTQNSKHEKEIQILGFKDLLGISRQGGCAKEVVNVPGHRSLSTKSFGTTSYRTPDVAQHGLYQNKGINSEEALKRSKRTIIGLGGRANTSFGIDDDKYRKSVDHCLHRYINSSLELLNTSKGDESPLDRVKDLHDSDFSIKKDRPNTAFAAQGSVGRSPLQMKRDTTPKVNNKAMSPQNRLIDTSDEKTSFFDEIKELDHLTDFQKARPSQKGQESAKQLDEKSYQRYRKLKETLKLEPFTRVQRYHFNNKRVIVPRSSGNESPVRNGLGSDTPEYKPRNHTMLVRGTDEMMNKVITDQFKIEKIIGQGSYASVRLVVEKSTGFTYALKSYNKSSLNDPNRKESVQREIAIMQNLDHPNIIRLEQTIQTSNQIHLLMEYGGNISLQSYMKTKSQKRLSESEAKPIIKQILEGLNYIHSNNIAHRDLKLENILFSSQRAIKIIDFGFSVVTPKNKPLDILCGTPSYMAPELIARKQYFGHLVDIWALGILLYVILSGRFPFQGATNKELYTKILQGQYRLPDDFSPEVRVLIKKMLRMNPHERPSAKEILTDRWITGAEEQQTNLKDFLSSKIEEYRNLQRNV